MTPVTQSFKRRHRWFEDLLALVTGAVFVSLGAYFLKIDGLLTGGVAGASLLLKYLTGMSFGWLYFTLNLPFYALGWKTQGPAFVLKTFAAVALIASLTELLPSVLAVQQLHPGFAAIAGGLLLGTGFLVLFRHRSSAGGVGMLALYLQQTRGWRAGYVLGATDLTILLAGFFLLPLSNALWSLAGAAAINLTIALNHRTDRYVVL
jgi:uncharacterized membrane-anchored protein YitT (DUF2179 family)